MNILSGRHSRDKISKGSICEQMAVLLIRMEKFPPDLSIGLIVDFTKYTWAPNLSWNIAYKIQIRQPQYDNN